MLKFGLKVVSLDNLIYVCGDIHKNRCDEELKSDACSLGY